uniref:Uncharacterized protein n=1 Tax=Rhipicephalus zambeziensis TaxID=60191 RepID=A0A224Y5X8_9ACAR
MSAFVLPCPSSERRCFSSLVKSSIHIQITSTNQVVWFTAQWSVPRGSTSGGHSGAGAPQNFCKELYIFEFNCMLLFIHRRQLYKGSPHYMHL